MRLGWRMLVGLRALATAGLIALATFTASAPSVAAGQAQDGQAGDGQVRDEEVGGDEDAAEFFGVLEQLARSGQALPIPKDQQAELDREFGKLIGELMAPGALEPDWNRKGADARTLLGGDDGEANAKAFVGIVSGSKEVTLRDEAAARALIGTDWIKVASVGASLPTADLLHGIAYVSPKVIVYVRTQDDIVGTATCVRAAQGEIYSDPGKPATEEDMMAFFAARYMIEWLNTRSVCEVFRAAGPGRFETRTYDRSGRRLQKLDAERALYELRSAKDVSLD